MKKPCVMIICAAVLAVILIFLAGLAVGISILHKDASGSGSSLSAGTDATPGEDDYAVDDIEIYTPYCTLHYPPLWTDVVRFDSRQEAGRYTVCAIGMIGDRETELFHVVFGDSMAMPVGTLQTADGPVTVRLDLDVFVPDDSWTQVQIAHANTMIADVEYLIDALEALDTYTAVND